MTVTILNAEQKKALVAEAIKQIENGEVIKVVDASSSALGLCIGDFRDIGWSKRCATTRTSYYEWNGPTAIIVSGERIEPGQATEEIDVDWT